MAALIYASGFQVGGTSTMTATVAGSVATITAGTYLAGDETATAFMPVAGYTGFAAIVKSVFDAATSSTFTVAWSYTTGKYTISRAANFTLAFSTLADLRLRAALGFTGDKSGTNTYTSDEVPKYVLLPAITARTAVSNVYEPEGLVEEAVSDGGDAYGTTLRTGELLSDWTQAYESKAATFSRSATTPTHGWCWQAFFAHHRGTHPFGVTGPGTDDVTFPLYMLRADGASFAPQRVTSDDDTYWSIPFRCRDLGLLSP
jgi:hypothetical protein